MRRSCGWLVACALLAAPAFAQSTKQRLDDLSTRIDQLEQTLQSQALVELSQRVEALTAELRGLRGELEVLQNENAQLRKQQGDALADFDRRLGAVSTASSPSAAHVASQAPVPATAPSPVASVEAPAPAASVKPEAPPEPVALTPEQHYGRAFDALKASDYPAAIAGMRDFIARHPEHPLADNAYYWLGQTYYLTRDYAQAIDAFASVGSRSPDSAKAPDAALKRGLCEVELKRTEAARRTFNELVTRYPASDAARLAREQLQRLR